MPNSAQNSMPNNSQSDMWEPMAPPASADFFANLRQIIGPYIGCATSVGAECNDDIVIWELGFKISLCQPRVVPLRSLLSKKSSKRGLTRRPLFLVRRIFFYDLSREPLQYLIGSHFTFHLYVAIHIVVVS